MTDPAINSVWVHRKDGGRWRVVDIPTNVTNRLVVSPADGVREGDPAPRMGVDRRGFLLAHVPEEEYRKAPAPPSPTALVVGSVVRLNSGGPAMTVSAPGPEGYWCVVYVPDYGTEGKVVRDTFPAGCLTVESSPITPPTEEPDASLPPR